MRPHRFDVISFVFGVLFLGVVAMAFTGTFAVNQKAITWVGAGALLLIGAVMLLGSRTTDRRRSLPDTDDEE